MKKFEVKSTPLNDEEWGEKTIRVVAENGIEALKIAKEKLTKNDDIYAIKEIKNEIEVLSWDQYFMSVAHLSGLRSKDPNTQVGACIINEDKRIVGVGYNGMPFGCEDDEYPWERNGSFMETKYAYVVHAELNAILNSTKDLKNCSIYVSLFPCNECAKAIIQSGITEVVYESDKYAHTDSVKTSKKMFKSAEVTYRKIEEVEVKVNI